MKRKIPKRPAVKEGDEIRRPASEFNLTPDELAMLPDPKWVTEDDADAIVAFRRRNEPKIPLEHVMRKLGYLDRHAGTKR